MTDAGIPAILTHAQRFYRELENHPNTIEQSDGIKIFTGLTTAVFNELEPPLPQPYYHQIARILERTHSIEKKAKGSRNSLSVWVLYHEPTLEDYTQLEDWLVSDKKLTNIKILDKLTTERLAALNERLGEVELEVEKLKRVILEGR